MQVGTKWEVCTLVGWDKILGTCQHDIVMLFVELNDMKLCACNIWNAYLEAYTKENVGLFAGPEFGKLDGRTLLISNCWYGFRSSGAR